MLCFSECLKPPLQFGSGHADIRDSARSPDALMPPQVLLFLWSLDMVRMTTVSLLWLLADHHPLIEFSGTIEEVGASLQGKYKVGQVGVVKRLPLNRPAECD